MPHLNTKTNPNYFFRMFLAILTNFGLFAQDRAFTKCFWFWICLEVLENIYLEQIVQNGFYNFCILQTNPFDPKRVLHTRILVFCTYIKNIRSFVFTVKIFEFSNWITFNRGFIELPFCNVCRAATGFALVCKKIS